MTPRPKVTPIAPERFAVQFTVGRSTHDKLRYAQELLSHQIPSGNVAEVIDLALDALIGKLEKRKFAATDKPRSSVRRTTSRRHIPAHVQRAVWDRDGGQCTFVSDSGKRCDARKLLQFDHIDPVARGGIATVEGMRLLCRPHNQYEAECAFGTAGLGSLVFHERPERDVSAKEVQRAVAHCETIPDASLEQRVRYALSFLRP